MIYLHEPNWTPASEPKVGRAAQRKPELRITSDEASTLQACLQRKESQKAFMYASYAHQGTQKCLETNLLLNTFKTNFQN